VDPLQEKDQSDLLTDIVGAFAREVSHWSVVLIRNADRLSEASQSALHRPVSQLPAATTVIAVGRRPVSLAPSFASLFWSLQVEAPRPQDRRQLLETIGRAEALTIEGEALEHIAYHAEPGFRAALRDLEQIAQRGGTLDVAMEYYGYGGVPGAVLYLKSALGGGSLASLSELLEQQRGVSTGDIAAILSSLLRFHLRGPDSNDGSMLGLSGDQQLELLQSAAVRVNQLKLNLSVFYQRALEIWNVDEREMRESRRRSLIDERSLQFFNFLAGLEPSSTKSIRKLQYRKALPTTQSGSYLTADQVGEIIDSASVLVQEFGKKFNHRILVYHRNEHVIKAVKQILQQLRQKLDKRGRINFHYISLHERRVEAVTRIVAHLPVIKEDLQHWLSRFEDDYEGIEKIVSEAVGGDSWDAHVSLVRELCGGLNPNCKVRVGPKGFEEERYLLDVLRVPEQSRGPVGQIGSLHRTSASRHLKQDARSSAELPYRFVGNNRDWRRALSEKVLLDEHHRRRRVLTVFNVEREKIRERGGSEDAMLRRIEELRASLR
jgi:DNA polymerase III delta prime subunit